MVDDRDDGREGSLCGGYGMGRSRPDDLRKKGQQR